MTANQNLWAPWRMPYLEQGAAKEKSQGDGAAPACFLCEAAGCEPGGAAARAAHVLLNDARGVLLLNLYPYASGHLLAAPHAHAGTLNDLAPETRAGLMELAALGERLLRAAVDPQGFNVGINVGRAAGAGVPGHLHLHVVPRWAGDTNFLTVLGQARVMPEAIERSYDRLQRTLEALGEGGAS